jgi:hypothetical protein
VTKVIELRLPECAITGENIHAQGLLTFAMVAFRTRLGWPQTKLSVHWEELTAADFQTAIGQSQGTCLLPFGILEKHGPHLPLGTDLLNVRYEALHAAEQEYAVVFPEYYFGQIFEARREAGAIAYSTHLQLELLFTPASGGTRAFLITIQATVRPQAVSAASLK